MRIIPAAWSPQRAIFPKIGEDAGHAWILTAIRDRRGRALLRKARVQKSATADKPLSFTPLHVQIGRGAGRRTLWMGRNGWEKRLLLHGPDLFTPFGFGRPATPKRRRWGRFINIRNLLPSEREAHIIRQGVPWRTLLGRRVTSCSISAFIRDSPYLPQFLEHHDQRRRREQGEANRGESGGDDAPVRQ